VLLLVLFVDADEYIPRLSTVNLRWKANDGGGPALVATPLLLKRAGARFFGGDGEDAVEDESFGEESVLVEGEAAGDLAESGVEFAVVEGAGNVWDDGVVWVVAAGT
jgi:hypothetical protein